MGEDLWEAYRNTRFFADTPRGRLCLRVGQISNDLDILLETHGAASWAYITAFNPASVGLSEQDNAARHAQLRSCVLAAGHVSFGGEGIGADDQWPPEPSLLIIGIRMEQAIELGRKFGQNAIVVGRRGGPAELARC